MFAVSLGVGTLSVLLSELLSVVAEEDVSELVELLSVLEVAEEDDTAELCDNSELTLSLEFGSLEIISVEVDVPALFAVSLSELLLQATSPKASVSNNKLEIMRFILSLRFYQSDNPCRNAADYRIRFYVFCNDCTCGNNCPFAHGNSRQNGCI